MTLPLRPILRQALLVLVCVGFVPVYLLRVVRIYLAQRSVYSAGVETRVDEQLKETERAIQLVPDNAEFPHVLGLELSAADQDDNRAITTLLEAAHLNPNSGQYWLDLASVYQATGNVKKQNEAVRAASRAESGNPEVGAEAAQYFLVAGDVDEAFPLFRQSLAQNPEAAKSILPICWRQSHDANLILSRVIPDSPELQLSFLSLLAAQKETAAAKQVWQYLVASHRAFAPQLSFFYFDYLLHEHDVAGFDQAWRELAVLSPNLQAYLPTDNLIVNGGFEQQLLNSGFDWRYGPADDVTAGIDDSVEHSGSRSLSLSYDGAPAYEAGWTQYVPVQSNTDYEFGAWIKSENVTSASGPRIALIDAFSGANLLLTDDVLDTHPWREMTGTLRVPAGTELIAVKITRAPADTRIRGRVWIDDLRLVKR